MILSSTDDSSCFLSVVSPSRRHTENLFRKYLSKYNFCMA